MGVVIKKISRIDCPGLLIRADAEYRVLLSTAPAELS